MPVANATIAAIFDEIADLLDIEGANPFRIRAYRNAARTIGEMGTDISALVDRDTALTDIPGIGEDLADKIREIVSTGTCQALERLRKEVPPAVTELLRIPGLGPKRVKMLWHDLDVQTMAQLLRAAKDGRIRSLHGFGEKTERRILEAAQAQLSREKRFKLSIAAQFAANLSAFIRDIPGVTHVEVAGSFRRMKETVGDLDVLVTADAARNVMDQWTTYPDIQTVHSKGPTRATVSLKSGMQVDVRVVPNECFGAALQYFTGSKAHNITLRRIAQERGFKLNEYGLFKGQRRIAGDTEVSVYKALGLPWIPPELREDHGEIDAARAGTLPELVELADLRGDLHCHTNWSDGHNTIKEMALAAKARGLQYIAVTEHSKRLTVAHGLDATRLLKQAAQIREVNKALEGVTVLTGIEVDILEDGRLDLPDEVLSTLDIVIAAVHSKFDLSRSAQTARVLRAMENPNVRILAHPTGRLIDEREPYDIDMAQIIGAAARRRIALEINSHPQRLDLIDTYCRQAKEAGVLIAINSDAHSTYELDGLGYGVGQARRGWLEKRDILNARNLSALRKHWPARLAKSQIEKSEASASSAL